MFHMVGWQATQKHLYWLSGTASLCGQLSRVTLQTTANVRLPCPWPAEHHPGLEVGTSEVYTVTADCVTQWLRLFFATVAFHVRVLSKFKSQLLASDPRPLMCLKRQ